ncbi:hypothetical protein RhiJN_02588 [Ceratobasidium sp. AG-Ba]|nr:hypothetical protein RhiJN_02588 [Ceratobasidium sp. AG-Ba]QRW09578.1 hypothetical protein RhiLY_08577 [Ceratobasidium sp. AG-Ba]
MPYELVHIPKVKSIWKERDTRYCNGNALGLWLYTETRAFGLMLPSEYYASSWEETLRSWCGADSGEEGEPRFSAVTDLSRPPDWWHEQGQNESDASDAETLWSGLKKDIRVFEREKKRTPQDRSGG